MAKVREFKDPTRLGKAIFIALLVDMLASVTTAAVGVEAILFLERVEADLFPSYQAGQAAAEVIENHEALASTFQLVSLAAAGVLILMWIHRTNANARALGATGMRFSPGWSVGWYFVPIANLWKPYQAMKEIWRASAEPANWQVVEAPPLLPIWWTLWLAVNFSAQASARLVDRADNLELVTVGYVTGMVSDVAHVGLDAAVILLVARLSRIQLSTRAVIENERSGG